MSGHSRTFKAKRGESMMNRIPSENQDFLVAEVV
jgi:hypothetical protein